MATKKSPGASVRLSIAIRATGWSGVPRTMRPPVAAAMWAAVKGRRSTRLRDPAAGAAAPKRAPRHLDVVEGQRPIANDLVLLVSLPGDEHEIAGPRDAHRPLDRLRAIDDREIGRPLRAAAIRRRAIRGHDDAALDFFDDGGGALGAGVVGGNHDEVAQPRRHRPHERPLRAVAIPAAAEHRDDTPA